MSDDTDKHERIDASEAAIATWRANAHPACIAWLEMRVKASRQYKEDAAMLAGFEALLEMARMLSGPVEAELVGGGR